MDQLRVGNNGGNKKIPRGYRLKKTTHEKIRKLQNITRGSQDAVISAAIRLYSRKLAGGNHGK